MTLQAHSYLRPTELFYMLLISFCTILSHHNTFKCLGLLLTSNLSWTKHIERSCSKAKQILGLLYRRFYRHFNEKLDASPVYLWWVLIWNTLPQFGTLSYLQNTSTCLRRLNSLHINYVLELLCHTTLICTYCTNLMHDTFILMYLVLFHAAWNSLPKYIVFISYSFLKCSLPCVV